MPILTTLGIACIPGSLAVAAIKYMFSKWIKKQDSRDKMRENRDYLMYKGITASVGLSCTMAKELEEKQHANGETQEYLDYALKTKHDLEDYYAKMAAESMN